ncbi:hypothetical protein HGRIS_000764 [Hohenbuehelia grisea]|uniref:Uncharacterized protein n=1 Tax=Hohenbuehelia grisea TaxID=104357 RepID=A0ABR3IPT3_9AGAR
MLVTVSPTQLAVMAKKFTPYTLNEFDIVLSINEAAINAQFLHLFLTELRPTLTADGTALEPPPPVPGQLEPDKEYLISHRLELKKGPKSKEGVFGYIESPRVSFNNENQRTVTVMFKFLDNKLGTPGDPALGIPAYDAKYDSVAKIRVEDKDGEISIEPFPLNGHTICFDAILKNAEIQTIMEKRYMHPDTYKAIEHGINSELLLPSSLFCLFQGDQIASSFKILDPSGKRVQGRETVDEIMLKFTSRFAEKAANAKPTDTFVASEGRGLPTPDNPFVLGYGISQVVPEASKGVPVFNLPNFQFSVTGSSKPGLATLNYLMLTKPIHASANIQQNLNAGLFDQTLLSTIHADYLDTKKGTPVFDAVMGLSRELFVEQYIIPQICDAYGPKPPQIPGFTTSSSGPKIEKYASDVGGFNTVTSTDWWTNKANIHSDHFLESAMATRPFREMVGNIESGRKVSRHRYSIAAC